MPADTRQPFVLVTAADVQLKQTDVPAPMAGDWVESAEGIRARVDFLALVTFDGIPSNRIQERTTVRRLVGLALPDLVLLRDGLDHIITEAVGQGLLQLP